jgi:L-alanine-DL-glutamate epimerase-like enolase superfamily enzyme
MNVHSRTSRRHFLSTASTLTGLSLLPIPAIRAAVNVDSRQRPPARKPITIRTVGANHEREPLLRPYGFKGGSVSESFHSVVLLESTSGKRSVGVSKQSVLWSDEYVAAVHTYAGGNALMFSVTEYALQLLKGRTFEEPMSLQDEILPDVYDYASQITRNPGLRMNFVLNALVGVDHAVWLLYAAENGIESYDAMIPDIYRPAVSYRHPFVASIPSLSYNTPVDDFEKLVEEGFFIMKIKIGQPGEQREMLEKDKARLTAIHDRIGDVRTEHTEDGKLPYYLDANGRYEERSTVEALLEHAQKIGAFDQIILLEDPFAVENKTPVHGLGVTVGSDEGSYDEVTAQERIEQGYRAFGLKPIAKTLTKMLRVAKVAHDNDLPAYCADLTAYPLLLEWNKSFVARLAPFPGLGFTFIEANGHQNYRDWEEQISHHPMPDAPWIRPVDGVYRLPDTFYTLSGGVLKTAPYYLNLVDPTATASG